LTVKLTVRSPGMLYVCDGFCSELCVEPSSKFQSQLEMLPVDWSVNLTVNGTQPDLGLASKFAVGGGSCASPLVVVTAALATRHAIKARFRRFIAHRELLSHKTGQGEVFSVFRRTFNCSFDRVSIRSSRYFQRPAKFRPSLQTSNPEL